MDWIEWTEYAVLVYCIAIKGYCQHNTFWPIWDNIGQMTDTQNVQNIISKNQKPKLMKLYKLLT